MFCYTVKLLILIVPNIDFVSTWVFQFVVMYIHHNKIGLNYYVVQEPLTGQLQGRRGYTICPILCTCSYYNYIHIYTV